MRQQAQHLGGGGNTPPACVLLPRPVLHVAARQPMPSVPLRVTPPVTPRAHPTDWLAALQTWTAGVRTDFTCYGRQKRCRKLQHEPNTVTCWQTIKAIWMRCGVPSRPGAVEHVVPTRGGTTLAGGRPGGTSSLVMSCVRQRRLMHPGNVSRSAKCNWRKPLHGEQVLGTTRPHQQGRPSAALTCNAPQSAAGAPCSAAGPEHGCHHCCCCWLWY